MGSRARGVLVRGLKLERLGSGVVTPGLGGGGAWAQGSGTWAWGLWRVILGVVARGLWGCGT